MAQRLLHPDRLFPSSTKQRAVARRLYEAIAGLPIVSPHGHTDPAWFATNQPFANPAELLITPDHYVFRMLYSQGVALEKLGIFPGGAASDDYNPRAAWQCFADHYYLFRGTPSRLWFDWVFENVFGFCEPLAPANAGEYYDHMSVELKKPVFRPRALFDRFNIEILATTEDPLDALDHHKTIADSDWGGRVITTYRPDNVVDPDYEGFADNVSRLGEITGEDTHSWRGYLAAHRKRRLYFKKLGATATDHGHPCAHTEDLDEKAAEQLFQIVIRGKASANEARAFRGQMLLEMAKLSLEDGLVMQIHPGSHRNHNRMIFSKYGRDKGADIPTTTNYVAALKPMLDVVGNERDLRIIIFTLDETAYARELAPLAGHYPCLRLGPPWWFHDSPAGMNRYRDQVTETAGFYNTVGFNDDTRAFFSIPARHDVARRMDCVYLSRLVCEHQLREEEAAEIAVDLTYNLVRQAYRFDVTSDDGSCGAAHA